MTIREFPILASKLLPPIGALHHLEREVGRQALTRSNRIVLVRAPAGFGKTTCMLQLHQYASAQGMRVAWLTLDESDNDLTRLLAYMREALRQLGVSETPAETASELISAICAPGASFVWFLDEFDVLTDPAVLAVINEIIARLPPTCQLVIGCRRVPNLPLARLRARAQLGEVSADELRFSKEETAQFLRQRVSDGASADVLQAIHEKTEGWPAALWLASISLSEKHLRKTELLPYFDSAQSSVSDYLAEDVLDHEEEPVRSFLLNTSILDELTGEVCDALNATDDSLEMLENLSRRGLFVNKVSHAPAAWRYHGLFAEFLRARLQRAMGSSGVERLHAIAAQTYASMDRPVPAINHFLLAEDRASAMTWMLTCASSLLEQGRMNLLTSWFDRVGVQTLKASEVLVQVSLWALCFSRGANAALEKINAYASAGTDPLILESATRNLSPIVLAMEDRYEEAYVAGLEALKHLPGQLPFAESALRNVMAHLCSMRGQPDEARQFLQSARKSADTANFNRSSSEVIEGMLNLFEGRFQQAAARFRLASELQDTRGYFPQRNDIWFGVFQACAMYQVNELQQAEQLFNIARPLASEAGLPDHLILSFGMGSRIAFHYGDVDQALHLLAELESLGHRRRLPRAVAGARLDRLRMFLWQGKEAAARDELARVNEPGAWPVDPKYRLFAHDLDYPALAKARCELVFGSAAEALSILDREINDTQKFSRPRRLLKLKLLRSAALFQCGQKDAALRLFEEVVRVTASEGFLRFVVDEGFAFQPLIGAYYQKLLSQPNRESDETSLLIKHLRLIGKTGKFSLDAVESSEPTVETSDIQLTPKEHTMLLLLADGFSNSAMSEKLFISDSTVRTHLRNINVKLGVGSRAQAVAAARKLGLVR